jgi:hypothetical protein
MSSLLEPDFSLTPSETAESSIDHSKRFAPVWKHTRRPNPDEDQALLYCKYCQLDSIPPPYGSMSSGNMTKHIKRHHKEVSLEKSLSKNQGAVNQQIKELYRHTQGLGNIEEFDLEVLEACLNPIVLIEALITLIVI